MSDKKVFIFSSWHSCPFLCVKVTAVDFSKTGPLVSLRDLAT